MPLLDNLELSFVHCITFFLLLQLFSHHTMHFIHIFFSSDMTSQNYNNHIVKWEVSTSASRFHSLFIFIFQSFFLLSDLFFKYRYCLCQRPDFFTLFGYNGRDRHQNRNHKCNCQNKESIHTSLYPNDTDYNRQ